jgi:hypothetical protein
MARTGEQFTLTPRSRRGEHQDTARPCPPAGSVTRQRTHPMAGRWPPDLALEGGKRVADLGLTEALRTWFGDPSQHVEHRMDDGVRLLDVEMLV